MTAEELSMWAIESELRRAGHRDLSRSASVLAFPPLAMEFLAHDAKLQPRPQGMAAVATFEARAAGADSSGIRVLAVGFGDTESAAVQEAACQWVLGVFPALRSYVARPDHICDVEKAQMLVGLPDTDERYGWTIHLPPVIWRVYGSSDIKPDVRSDEVYRAIFDALHPFAAHNHLFWLECFASRYPDGQVDATCRYDNHDWPEGQQSLLLWAAGWPDTEGCIVSKRQFLMFEPTPVDNLPSRDSLSETINKEIAKSRKPWWKAWRSSK